MAFDATKVETLSRFSADFKVPWVYPGLMEYGGMNMLFGVSRARKSTLNSYLFASALLGMPAFGTIPVENIPTKALLVYGEGRLEAEIARLLRVCQALGATKHDLLTKVLTVGKNSGLRLSNEQDANQLAAFCNQQKVDLISLDSLANFNSFDENSNNQMAFLAGNISKLNREAPTRTILTVHHVGKASTEGRTVGQNARGGSALPAVMDNNLLLTKKGQTNDHTLELEDKYHGGEGKLLLKFDPATWLWSVRSKDETDLGLEERLRTILAEHPEYSATSLAKAAGGRYAEVLPLAKTLVPEASRGRPRGN